MKYIIEGNIDFYNELYKSLDDTKQSEPNEDTTNLCLITGELLTDNHVILNCNHKFNYIPLFKDLYNYKKKFSYMDSTYSKTKVNEIRCPYCRSKQTTMLPYYENIGVEKVPGINHDASSLNTVGEFKKAQCCWQEQPCPYTYVSQFAVDGLDYCYSHLKKMTKKVEKEKKMAAKEKKAAEKLKEKQDAKNAKLKLLAEASAAKKALSAASKNKNIILSESTPMENVILSSGMCKQTLKTGPRKGCLCGAKTHEDGYCLRHYKLITK
jgi:hypothetical protein